MKWSLLTNKKLGWIVAIILSVLILFGILFTASDMINKNTNHNGNTSTNKDTYYFDPELNEVENNIKLAVENYASQDDSESKSDRIKRLAKYFSKNSSVYNRKLEHLNDVVRKTTAKVHTIRVWEKGDNLFSVVATATLINYYDGGSYELEKSYWVLLSKKSQEIYLIEDIELFSYV